MNDREREKLVKILSPLTHTMESEKKWDFGQNLPDSNLTRKLDIFGFHKHFLNNS